MATINEKMTAIANAIRAKTGKTAKLTLDTMASDLNSIANRTSSDLTASDATVTVPAGNYKSQATKSVTTVTRADTAISVSADDTKDKLTITASNNQGTGYVTGANKTASTTISLTASGATVTASDGTNSVSKSVTTATRADTTISVSADDTKDKLTITASNNQGTGYVTGANKTATKTITLTASGSSVTASDGTNKVSKSVATATQATPSISINSSGKITASATQTAGYVSAGTKSRTKQLTTQAAKTVTPTTSSQTAVASGVYTTGAVTVAAIPSSYVKPTATKAAATITPTTSNQTIAAGTYCSGAQTIAGDADLVAGNIKKGVNIFGVEGSYDAASTVLNFQVVGGTSAPSNPTNNTLWINTNVAIPKWSFYKNQPSWPMQDGWVYIVSEISTDVVTTSFDAIVLNEMWINPITAWQYVNGAWVQKDMQIYKNGAWIPYTVFLYTKGNQCSSTTGGWIGDNATDTGKYNVIDLRPYYLNGGYAGDSNGALRLSAAMKSGYGGYGAVSMATKNKIDLTNVKSIIVSANVYSSNEFTKIGVTSNDSIWNGSGRWNCAAYTNLVNGTTTLDVSSLSGSYHVVFGSHTGDNGASTSFAITEVVMK